MKIVQRPRQGGKTTYILNKLVEDPNAVSVISVSSMERVVARRLEVLLEDAGEPNAHQRAAKQIVSVQRLGNLRGRNVNIYIDDLDYVLYCLLHQKVLEATFTGTIESVYET